MRFLKFLIFGLFVGMIACAILLPEDAQKSRVIDALGKGVFITFGLLSLGYLLRLRQWLRRSDTAAKQPDTARIVGRPIVVDGSNVMHWGGEPSLKILQRVLTELQARGYGPLVYFDANVGYKLFDQHMDSTDMARKLGLPPSQVVHAPSRTPADEILLERAIKDNLRVVTNDRFLDWKTKFPRVGDKGFLIKGMWKQGSVMLFGRGRR
ncbi:NYN domain-containing protein [Loktanella agnita]|uniref:NYN domain-containing protein n=1 Tax=Loktanella agnita TaxID=287097 RepID=UPI0039868088